MARIATGLSKKSNRINAAALELCFKWREQYGIGVKVDPSFAWVVSGGKFGSKPENYGVSGQASSPITEATIDTFNVARYVIVSWGSVN